MSLLPLICIVSAIVLVVPGDCRHGRQIRSSPVRLGREGRITKRSPITDYVNGEAAKLSKKPSYNYLKNSITGVSSWIGGKGKRNAQDSEAGLEVRGRRQPDFHFNERRRNFN